MSGGLGRRVPTDWKHVEKYPFRAFTPPPDKINIELDVPGDNRATKANPNKYRLWYDQGREGACVGYSLSWAMTFLNRKPYTPKPLWQWARLHDEWPDNDDLNDPDQGTSDRAGLECLRTIGHWGTRGWEPAKKPRKANGILRYEWAKSIDDIRNALYLDHPIVMGINWYEAFDKPERKEDMNWWVAKDSPDLGNIRGGHSIFCYGVSDDYQAVKWINTWGLSYPDVWVPYSVIERLINEEGEIGILVDLPPRQKKDA